MGKPARDARGIREIIYGNKPHLYRILYEINVPQKTIAVLSIRHGKRQPPETGKP